VISSEQYITLSLEYNLFFLRIAKEHTIFLAASLPPKDLPLAQQSIRLKNDFERMLSTVVSLSRGRISQEVLSSGELVTNLTLPAEEATQFLTGVPINTGITREELRLTAAAPARPTANILNEVSRLNAQAIALLKRAAAFQTRLLRDVLSCRAFSFIYPHMLEHVTREVNFAIMLLNKLQNKDTIDSPQEIINLEINWNSLMEEHAKFIRGYLDPSENALFETANNFAKTLDALLARTIALKNQPYMLPEVTRESILRVTELRNFKRQGTEGILACRIKSIIPPLLSDHVLREANHYLRLLRSLQR
jgi:hypothetical protein